MPITQHRVLAVQIISARIKDRGRAARGTPGLAMMLEIYNLVKFHSSWTLQLSIQTVVCEVHVMS
jgi:hypothetical protein